MSLRGARSAVPAKAGKQSRDAAAPRHCEEGAKRPTRQSRRTAPATRTSLNPETAPRAPCRHDLRAKPPVRITRHQLLCLPDRHLHRRFIEHSGYTPLRPVRRKLHTVSIRHIVRRRRTPEIHRIPLEPRPHERPDDLRKRQPVGLRTLQAAPRNRSPRLIHLLRPHGPALASGRYRRPTENERQQPDLKAATLRRPSVSGHCRPIVMQAGPQRDPRFLSLSESRYYPRAAGTGAGAGIGAGAAAEELFRLRWAPAPASAVKHTRQEAPGEGRRPPLRHHATVSDGPLSRKWRTSVAPCSGCSYIVLILRVIRVKHSNSQLRGWQRPGTAGGAPGKGQKWHECTRRGATSALAAKTRRLPLGLRFPDAPSLRVARACSPRHGLGRLQHDPDPDPVAADPQPGTGPAPAPQADTELGNLLDSTPDLAVAGEPVNVGQLKRFYARHDFEPVWDTRKHR